MKIALETVAMMLSITGSLQKKKWAMMLLYTLTNIFYSIMYFAYGRFASAVLCIVGAIRTAVFMIYSIKNIKPNWMVLVFFEILFVLAAIFTWQDATDWMPLIAWTVTCYASWQDNTAILRIGYIINSVLYIAYNMLIGAYIASIPEFLGIITNTVALIYYNICKKEKPILSYFLSSKWSKEKNNIEDIESIENVVNQSIENKVN